ncbi:MAG: sulfatase [Planctomycetota bacterium]
MRGAHAAAGRGRARARVLSVVAAYGALASACGGRAPEAAPGRPNVLLISIDTLRADRLSCAGYPRATTPHLDALAARGVRFTHAQSPRAKTTPALASLMTGLYPHDHGVRDLAQPLGGRATTLAEVFAANGWSTAAIVGNYVLQRALSGLDRGFETWIEDLPDTNGVPPDDVPQRRATSLTDGALALLEERAAAPSPWFVWLHYMDPHGAYDAPPEHRVFTSATRDLVPDPERPPPRGRQEWIARYNVLEGERAGNRVDANAVRDRYDAEVRYVDAELGRLFAALEARGLDRNTWVIVCADHGESLGEHHYWFEHGRYAYEATCRVPLIIAPPRGAAAGGAAHGPRGVQRGDISLADLFPTLIELLALEGGQQRAPRGPHGRSRRSLLAALDGPQRGDASAAEDQGADAHPVFCEKVERAELSGAVQTKAVRIGDWKLSRRFARRGRELVAVDEELFDLAADPAEESNLAAEAPARAPLAALRAALLEFCAADTDLADLGEALAREREALRREDPEVDRRLRALGY